MKRAVLCAALVAASCGSVAPLHLDAAAAEFQAIAPEYRAYVEADPGLTDEEVRRKLRTVHTWQERIRAAGAAVPDVVLLAEVLTPTEPK